MGGGGINTNYGVSEGSSFKENSPLSPLIVEE